MKHNSIFMKKPNQLVIILVVLLFASSAVLFFLQKQYTNSQNTNYTSATQNSSSYSDADTNASLPSANPVKNMAEPSVAESLQYMLEEEKLAYDVYTTLYAKWGSRVFANISKSETNHQDELLAVMRSRGLADVRSQSVGVFKNQDLQQLYNKLIAQGSQSSQEAFKVGVAIEELDIVDLKKAINTLGQADTDVRAVYESLKRGSENHLSAFNRQLTR